MVVQGLGPPSLAVPSAVLQGLRPYQRDAVQNLVDHLREVRSTLLVMATGTGKTQVFVALASLARGRVLILAHRDELVQQAARRIDQMTGEVCGVEQAERRAHQEHFVVASVQTLHAKRLPRWAPDAFGLVVVDEAHHAASPSYRRILDHFSTAKVVGVTATPDRTDRQALGQVFETVAFEYGTWAAIDDGWLVPPKLLRIVLESVDLSAVRTIAGDLNQGQLEEAMLPEQVLHGIARPLLEQAGERKSITFMPGVASAHGLARVLQHTRSDCARALDGTTPAEDRRQLLADHRAGRFQHLVNCLVLTEGFDAPDVSCVAVARPTKSRALYAQMLGRGLRLAPGKTDCLLLDFVDASRRLDLAGPEDVLGQAESDEVVAEAHALLSADRESGGEGTDPLDLREALLRARARVKYRAEQAELRRQQQQPSARKTVPLDTAWRLFGLDPAALHVGERYGVAPASPRQLEALRKFGVEAGEIDRQAAQVALQTVINRAGRKLASPAQLRLLRKYLEPSPDLTGQEAKSLIDQLAENRWRVPRHWAA